MRALYGTYAQHQVIEGIGRITYSPLRIAELSFVSLLVVPAGGSFSLRRTQYAP